MRMYGHKRNLHSGGGWRALPLLLLMLAPSAHLACAQAASKPDPSQQVQQLTDAIARVQAQLEQSQHQLDEMRGQLNQLRRQMAASASRTKSTTRATAIPAQTEPATNAAAIQEIREQQAVQESQIATHDQAKVGSESRYPVKITGLLLLNGFVNTGAVDMAATPTLALPGSGSTGASVRQTVLGVDARGPHLFGARSFADLRVDFDGKPAPAGSSAIYSGYYGASAMLLRLRTVHATLQWQHTRVYFSLDHPIFSPDMPSSLTAVAEPALAWSGNLWTWNPQLGITHDFDLTASRAVRLQAALIDVGDAPFSPAPPYLGTSGSMPPSGSEQSRWPGLEARVALLGAEHAGERSNHFGIGGYFAPHRSSLGHSYNSWAGTLDARLPLPARLQFTASFYRGMALGGLGGGAYKDFAFAYDADSGKYYLRPLDNVGGWAELKEKLSERLEFNAAFGMDDAFASELRQYTEPGGSIYQNLARNRTYTGNVLYSPSAYLLFSVEYRHLESSPVIGPSAGSNIIGLGAGYKF